MTDTVAEIMDKMEAYDWLAAVTEDDNGDWHMLLAPGADPTEESRRAFSDDFERLMQAPDLHHVTELTNGWLVVTDE